MGASGLCRQLLAVSRSYLDVRTRPVFFLGGLSRLRCFGLAGFRIIPRRSDIGCVGTSVSNLCGFHRRSHLDVRACPVMGASGPKLCVFPEDQTMTFRRVPLWVRPDFVIKLSRVSRSDLDVRTCPAMGASGLCRQILAGFPNIP